MGKKRCTWSVPLPALRVWCWYRPKCRKRAGEITAIPILLDHLELAGCTVTIDALGTQRTIAKQIIDQQADYVLGLKENQEALLEETQKAFELMPIDEVVGQTEADHGRIEYFLGKPCACLFPLQLTVKPN